MAPPQTSFRRLRPVIPPILAAMLVLTACGGSAPAAPQGTFPATVTHRYGQVVVEEAPERIVSLGATDQDAVLALGAVPVAVREVAGRPSATGPWAADRLQGAQPQVLPAGEVAPEAVAALRPDLIVAVTADLTREQYEAFSRIAPTVAAPEGAVDGAVPWQDVTRLTSVALGLPGEGDRLVREVEEEFLDAEEAHPELAGATVAAVRPSSTDTGSFVAWSSRDLRGRFLTDLGMQLPAEVDREAGSGLYATLPAERLAELDRADAILVVGTEAERAALAALPGYDQLSLVQESKVVTLDDEQVAALSINSVLSLPSVVDEVSGRIGRAVER